MKKIITQHLFLRPLQVSDVTKEYIAALNDKEVTRLTEARHRHWDAKSVKQYVRDSNQKGVSLLLGMFLKDSKKHIGNVRLFNFSNLHLRVELGIMIFDKSQWGKGYATEVIEAVSKYVFDVLKLHKICADYYAHNAGSAAVFKKAGFVIEGVFGDHFLLDGKYVDSVRIAQFSKKK